MTSLSLFVPMNMVLQKYLACCEHSANVSHTAMRAVYPYALTLIKSKLVISCTTVSVEHCLSKMMVL